MHGHTYQLKRINLAENFSKITSNMIKKLKTFLPLPLKRISPVILYKLTYFFLYKNFEI